MLDVTKWYANNQPLWMRRALNLSTQQVPTALYVDHDPNGSEGPPIVPTIDAYQGGIGVAVPGQGAAVLSLAGGASTVIGLPAPADPTMAQLIYGIDVQGSALAADRTLQVFMSTGSLPLLLADGVISHTPVVPRLSWKAIAGTANARIYIPPGWLVVVLALDLAGAETFTVDWKIDAIPAGFKPF